MIHPLAAAALLLAQAAPAERPCITHEEAGDMAVSLLPYLIDAAAQRCRPHLGQDAFLTGGGAQWSERLRHDAAPRRESALRGIAKIGGITAPPGGGEATFAFVAQMVTSGLTNNIRPEQCGQIDAIAQSLQPLPTDNIARLVGAGLSLAMTANDDDENNEDEDGEDGPPICRS